MAKPFPTPIPKDVKACFWAKVDVRASGECWPWMGRRDNDGYGSFFFQRPIQAHQMAWAIKQDQSWPAGLIARHSCDNPCCVNPAHIQPGTPLQNAQDRDSRGRTGGFAKQNAAKTHCPRGHLYSPENTRLSTNGGRCCRQCDKVHIKRLTTKRQMLRARAALNPEGSDHAG